MVYLYIITNTKNSHIRNTSKTKIPYKSKISLEVKLKTENVTYSGIACENVTGNH